MSLWGAWVDNGERMRRWAMGLVGHRIVIEGRALLVLRAGREVDTGHIVFEFLDVTERPDVTVNNDNRKPKELS